MLKNKKNKKDKIMLKNHFTKDQMLINKKYPRLLGIAIEHNIPYATINRAYKRYLSRRDDYILINRYPNWWFRTDKDAFCHAVHVYAVAKEYGKEYNFGTRGFVNVEIVKLSGLDKFINILK